MSMCSRQSRRGKACSFLSSAFFLLGLAISRTRVHLVDSFILGRSPLLSLSLLQQQQQQQQSRQGHPMPSAVMEESEQQPRWHRTSSILGIHHCRFNHPCTTTPTSLRAAGGSSSGNGASKGNDKGFDPYQVLGVPRKATKQELKAAFRMMVSTNHPDKFPDNPARRAEAEVAMERINRAYYILGDEERRARYDRFGEEGVGTSAAGDEQLQQMGGDANMFFSNFGDSAGGFGEGGMIDLSDLLSEMFGGAAVGSSFFGERGARAKGGNSKQTEQRQKINGQPVTVQLNVSFTRAVFGGEEKVRVKRDDHCVSCLGSGKVGGAKGKQCTACGGAGSVSTAQRTPFGLMQSIQTCSRCAGSGEEPLKRCEVCKGTGVQAVTVDVPIIVPAGVESGYVVTVKDGGNVGREGGENGDLKIHINVEKHPRFRREGADIITDAKIPYVDAILGTEVKVEGLLKNFTVAIPPGSQPNDRIRIKGEGGFFFCSTDCSRRGDHVVVVDVELPRAPSAQEKEVFEKLRGTPSSPQG